MPCLSIFVIGVLTTAASLCWSSAGAIPRVDVRTDCQFHLDESTGTDADIPKWLRALDGNRVIVIGAAVRSPPGLVISPGRMVSDMVPPPMVQEFVPSTVVNRSATLLGPYPETAGISELSGIFHVGIQRDPNSGRITSVFRLDADRGGPIGTFPVPTPPRWAVLARRIGIGLSLLAILVVIPPLMDMNEHRLANVDGSEER